MRQPNTPPSSRANPSKGGDNLTLYRKAKGSDLIDVCLDIAELTTAYRDVTIRGPSSACARPAVVELVDGRSIKTNRLRERGITQRVTHFSLTHLVPSVLEAQDIKAESVSVSYNDNDAYNVALNFTADDNEKLLSERQAIWETIGKLGHFSIKHIPWLDRAPDLRVAHVRTDDLPNAIELVDSIEATIQAALPLTVSLAPVYPEPLTI
jgi:hypothetical protein